MLLLPLIPSLTATALFVATLRLDRLTGARPATPRRGKAAS